MINLSRVRQTPPTDLKRVEDFTDDFTSVVPALEVIDKTCATFFGIENLEILYGPQQHARVSMARQVAFWLSNRMTGASKSSIARHFKRDHTTIMHGVKRIDGMRENRPEIKAITDYLERELGA